MQSITFLLIKLVYSGIHLIQQKKAYQKLNKD